MENIHPIHRITSPNHLNFINRLEEVIFEETKQTTHLQKCFSKEELERHKKQKDTILKTLGAVGSHFYENKVISSIEIGVTFNQMNLIDHILEIPYKEGSKLEDKQKESYQHIFTHANDFMLMRASYSVSTKYHLQEGDFNNPRVLQSFYMNKFGIALCENLIGRTKELKIHFISEEEFQLLKISKIVDIYVAVQSLKSVLHQIHNKEKIESSNGKNLQDAETYFIQILTWINKPPAILTSSSGKKWEIPSFISSDFNGGSKVAITSESISLKEPYIASLELLKKNFVKLVDLLMVQPNQNIVLRNISIVVGAILETFGKEFEHLQFSTAEISRK